jgi:hypothetical protein
MRSGMHVVMLAEKLEHTNCGCAGMLPVHLVTGSRNCCDKQPMQKTRKSHRTHLDSRDAAACFPTRERDAETAPLAVADLSRVAAIW